MKYAFRLFLVAKPSGAARPVLDMSPWTTFNDPPPIHLYSAAEVLSTIPPRSTMIKIDLRSGFFRFQFVSNTGSIMEYTISIKDMPGHVYPWDIH
jgi:hypothetical protein